VRIAPALVVMMIGLLAPSFAEAACGSFSFGPGPNDVTLFNTCNKPIVITQFDDGACGNGNCHYRIDPGQFLHTSYKGRFNIQWRWY
jgi:hypothetical protein